MAEEEEWRGLPACGKAGASVPSAVICTGTAEGVTERKGLGSTGPGRVAVGRDCATVTSVTSAADDSSPSSVTSAHCRTSVPFVTSVTSVTSAASVTVATAVTGATAVTMAGEVVARAGRGA